MALCLHHFLYSTAQSARGGLIVPLFLPLILKDAIEQLPLSLSHVFLSLIYIPYDLEFKAEIQSRVCVCTDEGSLQQDLKEMRRQS